MQIRVLGDRIVVRRFPQKETVRGGIIIPDSAKEKSDTGRVVGLGPGRRTKKGELVALGVEAGDRILFGRYSGSEVSLDADEFVILREDEVLGILDGGGG